MLMSANLVWRDWVESWLRAGKGGGGIHGACRQLGQLNEICWSRYRPYSSWHFTLHTAASSHSHNTSTRISRPRESKHLDDGWQGRHRRRGYKLALHKGRNLVWFCVAVEYSSKVKAMSLCVMVRAWCGCRVPSSWCNEAWSHRGRGRSEAFSIRFTIIEQVEAPPLGPR